MIKKLLVTGCSIACGFDTFDQSRTKHNVRNSYGQHIADALDLEHENIALPGIDNRHIVQHLVQYLDKVDTSEYCVLIGWTTIFRESFYYKGQFYVWTQNGYPEFCFPYDSSPLLKDAKEKFHHWQERLEYINEIHNWYHDIMYAKSYLENHKIPYMMLNTYEPFGEIETEVDLIGVDSNRMSEEVKSIETYYDPIVGASTLYQILHNHYHGKEKKFLTKTRHFNIQAHKYLGEYFAPTMRAIVNIKNDNTD